MNHINIFRVNSNEILVSVDIANLFISVPADKAVGLVLELLPLLMRRDLQAFLLTFVASNKAYIISSPFFLTIILFMKERGTPHRKIGLH